METEDENYDVSETAIRDHSMLGAHGEKLCNNLDVHWMVKTCGSPKDETGKCVCVCVCVCVLCGPFTPSECLLSIGSRPIGLQYSFILQAVSRIPETAVFLLLAPPTSETSEMFHDSRVDKPDICGFTQTFMAFHRQHRLPL